MILLFLLLFSAIAQEPDHSITVTSNRSDFQIINIFVDIVQVNYHDGKTGTSSALNVLVSSEAQNLGMLSHKLNYHSGAPAWQGNINVYDHTTISYLPNFKKCNYNNSLACAKINNHWTLRTVVFVGEKFSTVTTYLHNSQGIIIGSGQRTIFGTIRWKPRWKLTKISEQGPFGGGSKEIFEMWPPEMQEIPPLITPAIVTQAVISAYEIKKIGCTTASCRN